MMTTKSSTDPMPGNSKQYMNKQASVEARFFATILTYGGPGLAPLLEKTLADHANKEVVDYAFYNILGGPKTAAKHAILDRCLILCAFKWKKLPGKDGTVGKILQPSSFDKNMQMLSYIFKTKGIQYNFKTDFNGRGQFHSIVQALWKTERNKDPSFGVSKNKATPILSLHRKLVAAIKEQRLQPYSNPEHLRMCVIFLLGYYCGFRGIEEHSGLMWGEQIVFGTYDIENGGEDLVGLEYVGVHVPFSKANNLKLGNTTIRHTDKQYLTMVESDDPHFCPIKLMKFYRSKCHPGATKFYAKRATPNQRFEYKRECPDHGEDIWYCPAAHGQTNWNFGKHKITASCKELAKICGVDRWEDCTAHALRALCITRCVSQNLNAVDTAKQVCHLSVNSQKNYASYNVQSQANRINALRAGAGLVGHVAKRPPAAAMAPTAPMAPTAAMAPTAVTMAPTTGMRQEALLPGLPPLKVSEREELEKFRANKRKKKAKKKEKKRARLQQLLTMTMPPQQQYGQHGSYPPMMRPAFQPPLPPQYMPHHGQQEQYHHSHRHFGNQQYPLAPYPPAPFMSGYHAPAPYNTTMAGFPIMPSAAHGFPAAYNDNMDSGMSSGEEEE